jgi:hypothetical protein
MTVANRRWHRQRSRAGWSRSRRRGVSDVVATILLLALTVTLFAGIFAFVTTFPSPPPQNNNQFQASLSYTANLTYVTSLRILHLAGPAVPGSGQIYLKSTTQPTAPEFANPYTVSSGLAGATQWNLGQTWNLTFPAAERPVAYGNNITVYVVANSQLLFSVILPGTAIFAPPTIVSTLVSPTPLTKGEGFTVYATVAGSYGINSVYVNLAAVPGGPSTPQLMMQNGQGQWYFPVPGGATSNGTFYAFVNASNAAGQQTTGAVVISVANSAGSSSGPLSVGVVLVPAPPNSGAVESVQAVVTYTGSVSNAALSVTFTGSSSPALYTYSGTGPSGLTITGPSSETVVSQATWTLPSPNSLYTYTVSATATVTGVGTVTGSTSFEPALLVLSGGSGCLTTSCLVGTSLTATGSAFSSAAGSTVTLSFGGAPATVSSCSTGSVAGSVITPTAAGAFVCTTTIPNGAPAGATSGVASDAFSGQSDAYAFTVTASAISLSPTSGIQHTSVTVTGSGFAVSSGVTLVFEGGSITVSSCSVGTAGATITTTAGGAFTCVWTIPYGSPAGGGSLVATDSSGQTTSASFSVTAWTLVLSPTTHSHTTADTVTLTGAGFAVSSTVVFTFNGTSITPAGCTTGTLTGTNTVTTTAGGAFVCTYTIAAGGTAGTFAFTASDVTSGQTVTAYFVRT